MRIEQVNLQFRSALSRRTQTKQIVLHHTASNNTTVQQIHRWHLDKGWAGIGYHFYVRKDGTVWRGRPSDTIGAHALEHNSNTVGIVAEGNYETADRAMPDVQFNALVWSIRHVRGLYGNLPLVGHCDLMATACPGRYFPMAEIRRMQSRGTDNQEQEDDMMNEARVRELIREEMRAAFANVGSIPSESMQEEFEQAIAAGITDGSRPREPASRLEVALMVLRGMRG